MTDDGYIYKVWAARPAHRDAVDVQVVRYRKMEVGWRGVDGVVHDRRAEHLREDGTWVVFEPYEDLIAPTLRIDGRRFARGADPEVLEALRVLQVPGWSENE